MILQKKYVCIPRSVDAKTAPVTFFVHGELTDSFLVPLSPSGILVPGQ